MLFIFGLPLLREIETRRKAPGKDNINISPFFRKEDKKIEKKNGRSTPGEEQVKAALESLESGS